MFLCDSIKFAQIDISVFTVFSLKTNLASPFNQKPICNLGLHNQITCYNIEWRRVHVV